MGTLIEDHSPDGSACDYLTHDRTRSHSYRWGKDVLGGFGDRKSQLC